jgi:hypothetical protein
MTFFTMFCKGVIMPGLIVLSSMILSIINYSKVYNCEKITGYLDGDLYTNSVPQNDIVVMNILITYSIFYFIFNYILSKSTTSKESYYLVNALISIASPLIGFLWMVYPEPTIPASVYYSLDNKYIMLENVSLTYLRDDTSKVRIIMANERFQGFSDYLSPGPWIVPFSFTWMNTCLEQFINFQSIIKSIYIVLVILGSLYSGILILASYLKFRKEKRIRGEGGEEEKKSMI